MNKKITIYDLINRIHDNKDIPKKLKYGEGMYIYEHFSQDYVEIDDGSIYLLDAMVGMPGKWLDKEVEILEDEKDIDIKDIEELVGNVNVRMNNKTVDADDLFYTISNIVKSVGSLKDKTNQLIKSVKQLEKNKVDYIQPYKED